MLKIIHLSLALISFALIAFQIILMQILSITQWYHFAFMIISLALLGFGAAGTVLSLYKDWFIKRIEYVLPLSMLTAGIFILVSVPVSQLEIFKFDTYLVFADSRQIFKLIFTYLIILCPFFFGAIPIGLIFVNYSKDIGKLYFSNLLGSGFGGLGALIILWYFSPNITPLAVSLFPLLAGLILINKINRKLIIPVSLICTALIIYFAFNPFDLKISQYKSLSRILNLPDAEIKISKNSPYGFIQVVESNSLRYAPGLSLSFRGNIPVRKAVFKNGNWAGPVMTVNSKDSSFVLNFTTNALVYKLAKVNNVLILNSGTGEEVVHAKKNNAKSITAVEPNFAMNSIIFNNLAKDTDSIYYDNNVSLIELSPRTFLQTDSNLYGIIILPAVGVFGGGAGTEAAQENYLFTAESFQLILNKLKPEGYVVASSWMDYPYRNPLRLLTTIAEGLSKIGIDKPGNHIISVRSWSTLTYLIKKNKLSSDDIITTRKFCSKLNFDPVILPGITEDERTKYNQLQDDKFFDYVDAILSINKDKFISDYAFRISSPTDNKPYFSQFLSWKNLPEIKKYFGLRTIPFFELGYLIIILTLIQIVIISILLVILPLFKLGWRSGNKGWTILYFSGLGIGYMFIEIVLIQKFILYFGHPILAVSAVISFMLICSGIGSFLSSYLKTDSKNLFLMLGGIIFFLLVYIFVLDFLINETLSLSFIIKILISFFIIGLPAFLMGFPFPLGIKKLNEISKPQIPWAWGINGCLSVISTSLAAVISIEIGFAAVFLLAAAAYGISFLANIIFLLK